jgi:hypothetical protein
MILKRGIPRMIFCFIYERRGWRIRTNHELNKLIAGANIVRFTKVRRLKWWGHLHRMEEYRIVRTIFEWIPMGKSLGGQPRNRWRDNVLQDIRVVGVNIWTKVAMDTSAWHCLVEKSKTHGGL